MKLIIEGTPKEINDLLQTIGSSKEQIKEKEDEEELPIVDVPITIGGRLFGSR